MPAGEVGVEVDSGRRSSAIPGAALLVALLLLVAATAPAAAQEEPPPPPGQLLVSTPYPAVAVEAGETASFDLTVNAPTARQVDLAVDGLPEGWGATLRGGGFVIDGVFVDPADPPEVTLDVDVPADAVEGTTQVRVTADDGSSTNVLELSLRVAEAVGGNVTLESEFPTLQGASDATFNFDLTLANDTPEEITFGLTAEAPQGWTAEARPSGESQATTTTVAGGEEATITVEVDPPDTAPAGAYPVLVTASGGGHDASVELTVDITGNFAMTLTTADERLNATTSAGDSTDLRMLVVNDGTAPLAGVELSASPPTGWEVTFEPETVEVVEPGGVAEVTATITAASDAIAGDYMVPITASVPEADSSVDIRTTVETSSVVGIIGILLIGIALLALAAVFRRFGRR